MPEIGWIPSIPERINRRNTHRIECYDTGTIQCKCDNEIIEMQRNTNANLHRLHSSGGLFILNPIHSNFELSIVDCTNFTSVIQN